MAKRTEDTDGTADTGAAVTTAGEEFPDVAELSYEQPATSSSASSPSSRAARPASRRACGCGSAARPWRRTAAPGSTSAEAALTAGDDD